MNGVRAFIVGVGRYEMAGWETDGPVRNACAVAYWLVANGVSPGQVHLFIDEDALLPAERAELATAGIIAEGRPSYATIEMFWRERLSKLAQPGDKLFTFWSGHGVTAHENRRLFFCNDFNDRRNNHLFNASAFLSHLRAEPLGRFTDQLFLADACGSYTTVTTDPNLGVPAAHLQVRQLAIYASPDGAYAREGAGLGAFTAALLRALARFERVWPDEMALTESLMEVTKDWTQQPFWVLWDGSKHVQASPILSGRLTGEAPRHYAATLKALVSDFAITGRDVRRHFNLSVAPHASALEPDARLQSLIDDLADHQDQNSFSAPFALVEFLLRLVADPLLKANEVKVLRGWLDANSSVNARTEAQAAIDRMRQSYALLIRIDGSLSGLTGYHAVLRYADLSVVAGNEPESKSVSCWPELQSAIRSLVEEKLNAAARRNLQIHFLVDPPQFGLALHEILLSTDELLGSRHTCVIHYRSRVMDPHGFLAADCDAWMQAVAALGVGAAPLVEIPIGTGPLSAEQGIFYAAFAVADGASAQAEVRKLFKALSLGAPYMCWPVAPFQAAPGAIRTRLGEMVSRAGGLSQVPATLRFERARGCEVAARLNVLWEDPTFKPFLGTAGAS